MLKKCFKYDFKNIIKIWWIAAVTLFILSVAAGFSLRNIALHGEMPDRHFILESTVIIIYYFSLFAIGILTSVLLCIRFYGNFYSDEGYLTFTLPVKRSTLLGSKVLNGFVFMVLTGITIVISVIIVTGIVPAPGSGYKTLFGELVGEFIELVKEIKWVERIWLFTYILELIVLFGLLELSSVLLLYMLITLGSVAVKKLKAVATVGFIVGASYVLSALLIPAIMAVALWNEAAVHLYGDFWNEPQIALVLLICCAVTGTACALFANVTQGCINRRLNLS